MPMNAAASSRKPQTVLAGFSSPATHPQTLDGLLDLDGSYPTIEPPSYLMALNPGAEAAAPQKPVGGVGGGEELAANRQQRTAAVSRSQPIDSQFRKTSSRFCCKALFALPLHRP
jgi:hypothetical protein